MASQDAFPTSYKDPLYASLDAKHEQSLGLPVGLLSSIRANGERTNHGQVSSAGAVTPYQFTPATRKAILDKYGIDVTLSPQNASEGAGLLLQEGLKRNGGDPAAAVGEYIGGTDRSNWGPTTKAYQNRVMVGQKQTKDSALDNAFSKWMADNPAAPAAGTAKPTNPSAVSGNAPDPLADAFGKWVSNQTLPAEAIDAYAKGTLPPQEMERIKAGVADGSIKLPPGMMLGNSSAVAQIPGGAEFSPPQPAPTIGQKVEGAIEAGLNASSGMTGGTVGMAGGFVKGTAQAILDGSFGTKEAADMIEREAMKGADALTYQPRTPTGQQYAQNVSDAMNQLVPIMPMAGELGGLHAGVAPIKVAAGDAVRSSAAQVAPAIAKVREVAQPMIDAVRPGAEAPAAAAPMPVEQLAKVAKSAGDGGIGSNRATEVLASQASPNPEVVKSAERLGIQDYVQPDHTTTNDAYRQVVATIKSANPGSELSTAERVGLENVGKRATDLVDEIGGTTDYSNLDKAVKGKLQQTIDDISTKEDGLWGKLRQQIPATTPIEAPATVLALKGVIDEMGGVEQARQTLPAAALKFLRPMLDAAGGKPTHITYAYLDAARKQIGRASSKGTGPFGDMETGMLKRLYGTLTADQEGAATKIGGNALETFNAAKAATALRIGTQDDLSALFGKNLDRSFVGGGEVGLPGAIRAVAAGDSSRLVRLLDAVPQDMRQSVVASGMASVFKKAATRGELDFTGYAKWYENLMRNRQAYGATMSNLPLSARKQLHALYKVSKGISDSLNARIKTGALSTIKDELLGKDTLISSLYSLVKRGGVGAVAGTVIAPIAGPGMAGAVASALTKAKPAGMAAVDHLIASPEFAQLVKSSSGSTAEKIAVKKVVKSPAFKKIMKESGASKDIGDPELWILQSMRPVQQPQQQQQRDATHTLH